MSNIFKCKQKTILAETHLTGQIFVILGLVGVRGGALEQGHGLGPLLARQEGQGDVVAPEMLIPRE